MVRKSIVLAFLLVMGLQGLFAETLTVRVEKADPGKGYYLFVGLSNKEEGYPDKSFTFKKVAVTSETVTVVFTDLPKGTYAVNLFQDANGNEILDLNALKIPKEKYGFSNNTLAPNYKKNMFELTGDMTVTIKLR